VDEAQDTSELQLACLGVIADTGELPSLAMVGDLDQSISAYTGASAAGCEGLATRRRLDRVELTENYRSSQHICDVAFHFSSRPEPDVAVGPDADCPVHPEVLVYAPAEPRAAANRFRTRLAELGEEEAGAAILARSNALCDEINGIDGEDKIDARPMALGRAVAAARRSEPLTHDAIRAIDSIVSFAAFGDTPLSQHNSNVRSALRTGSMELLKIAPDLEGKSLQQWIQESARQLTSVASEIVRDPVRSGGQVLRSRAAQASIQAAQFFQRREASLTAQTVHDIKGESRGAVLVVVDRLRRSRASQSALWSRPLLGEVVGGDDAEEIRIAFVALTRARRYCAVALPDDCGVQVIEAFEAVGFVLHHA
jgi:superfamily I DNA/RNA helicase